MVADLDACAAQAAGQLYGSITHAVGRQLYGSIIRGSIMRAAARLLGPAVQRLGFARALAWLRRQAHDRLPMVPLIAALFGDLGPEPLLTADRRPADDLTPTIASLRARTVLTAAPPRSRVPVLAGAAA
jgi:hypothetical protein